MGSYWFRNGVVHTMDDRRPWAESVVVHDEVIAFVGSDDDARAHLRDGTEEIDLAEGPLVRTENPLDVAPVLPGETLAGKYRVERVLGQGGMGIVVAATHLDLREMRAIKLIRPDADNDQSIERLLREARAVVFDGEANRRAVARDPHRGEPLFQRETAEEVGAQGYRVLALTILVLFIAPLLTIGIWRLRAPRSGVQTT